MDLRTSDYRSFILSPDNILKFWNLIEPQISRAAAYGDGELTPTDICRLALNNLAQIWATVDDNEELCCVTVTQIMNTENKKHLQIVSLTVVKGTVKQMQDQFHTLEDYAKQQGCSSLRAWGRKGWERKLKSLKSRANNPWRKLYYVYDQEI